MTDRRSLFGRRRLLRVSLAVGSAVLMGGASGVLGLRGCARDVSGLRCLSAQEYTTVAALASAMFPADEGFPVGAEQLDLARGFDAFLADEPAWNQDDLKKAILLLELGPMVFDRRAKTFRHLTSADRLAHFTAWAEGDHPVRRQAALALRKVLSVLFYDRPEVWPHIGYDGPLFKKGTP